MWNVLAVLSALLSVAVVDSLLSIDNALVLAVVVEHLPTEQRLNALRYGILGAYTMRGASILFAALLIGFWPLKFLGGAYLLWLALSHLTAHSTESNSGNTRTITRGFWGTVVLVEWFDFTFSLDNILATVGLSRETWIVILGVFISILAMRFVAGVFLGWLERFPILRTTAYLLVLFIGAKLIGGTLGLEIGEVETFAALLAIFVGSLLFERWTRTRRHRSAAPESGPIPESRVPDERSGDNIFEEAYTHAHFK